ncbi:hypothetical protein BG262_02870 [Floricoccus penangensis]|uniref:Uncharacterized protein n=1 Tax=Floricoccus penangensis TaxID=1859475 RepID=A0A9Q5JG38_9LACT|nr:hypothetical protein [Floricoccus penangensis]OFI46757.1 hypothetical protein BG262_02870 [Floricoccus penangensis]
MAETREEIEAKLKALDEIEAKNKPYSVLVEDKGTLADAKARLKDMTEDDKADLLSGAGDFSLRVGQIKQQLEDGKNEDMTFGYILKVTYLLDRPIKKMLNAALNVEDDRSVTGLSNIDMLAIILENNKDWLQLDIESTMSSFEYVVNSIK